MLLDNYDKAENTNIDFKEKVEYYKPKSWLKSVSAFANTYGGTILFGVSDNRKICGVTNLKKDTEKISELINSKIQPSPRYELYTHNEDSKDVIELHVGDGPKTPYYYVSDGSKIAFIRQGNESIVAPEHILDNLIIKGQNTTFDELESKYLMNEVSFILLNSSLKRETLKGLEEFKDYLSLELATKDKHITNAGLLLSDEGLLIQSKICCTRWKGLIKGSILGDAIDDKEYTGSIIMLLENAETFIKNNSKISWNISGMKRIVKEDYPHKAIREAIVNAIIHRDYQILGAEIHIDMFDDRLEITSPGGMIDGSFIQNLDITKIPSMRRNRVISDIFNRLHFMDKRGSGLTRIIEAYQDSQNKPIFCSNTSSFTVVLPNKGIENKEINQNIEAKKLNIVSDEDYFLIKLYKNLNGKVTLTTLNHTKELFDKFGYNYEFNRENVEHFYKVKKSRGAEIIKKLIENNIIEDASPTKYKFKK